MWGELTAGREQWQGRDMGGDGILWAVSLLGDERVLEWMVVMVVQMVSVRNASELYT